MIGQTEEARLYLLVDQVSVNIKPPMSILALLLVTNCCNVQKRAIRLLVYYMGVEHLIVECPRAFDSGRHYGMYLDDL